MKSLAILPVLLLLMPATSFALTKSGPKQIPPAQAIPEIVVDSTYHDGLIYDDDLFSVDCTGLGAVAGQQIDALISDPHDRNINSFSSCDSAYIAEQLQQQLHDINGDNSGVYHIVFWDDNKLVSDTSYRDLLTDPSFISVSSFVLVHGNRPR